eukprot:gene33552-40591_t
MARCILFISLACLVLCTAFSSLSSSSVGRKGKQSHLTHPENAQKRHFLKDSFAHIGNQRFTTELFSSEIVAASPSKGRPVTFPPHRLSVHQFVYMVLTATFVTCLIVADVIGVKIFEIKLPFPILGHTSIEHTCGMLTFPITFLLGDVINEYYGANATKQTVYIGLAMSVLVFMVMNLAQALPYLQKPFNVTPEAFNMIFGSAKLMYVASIAAYLVGQLTDIWLFGVIKRLTKGNLLWLRATGSTVISQLLDSFVVTYIAFSFGKTVTNQVPATIKEVLNIAITGYGLKFVIAGLITPILYGIRSVLHNRFGFEPLPVDYKEE